MAAVSPCTILCLPCVHHQGRPWTCGVGSPSRSPQRQGRSRFGRSCATPNPAPCGQLWQRDPRASHLLYGSAMVSSQGTARLPLPCDGASMWCSEAVDVHTRHSSVYRSRRCWHRPWNQCSSVCILSLPLHAQLVAQPLGVQLPRASLYHAPLRRRPLMRVHPNSHRLLLPTERRVLPPRVQPVRCQDVAEARVIAQLPRRHGPSPQGQSRHGVDAWLHRLRARRMLERAPPVCPRLLVLRRRSSAVQPPLLVGPCQ